MLVQAKDFREESDELYTLTEPLTEADFERATLFKGWTISDILGHLHFGNILADLTLSDAAGYQDFRGTYQRLRDDGNTVQQATVVLLDGLKGKRLRDVWRERYLQTAENYSTADPKARVKWVGPDMSVLSCITARLMETWAHGQAVYDLLGKEREDQDRIRNIAVLGVNTFGWTFANRGEDVPAIKPHVCLQAPSGDTWTWNEPSEVDRIDGTATEFCQVVAQTRNIADTGLVMRGETAKHWMAQAQCFAGPPQDPPAPGARHKAD